MELRQESTGTKIRPSSLPGLDSIAFFGTSMETEEQDAQVQILIWPTTGAAWRAITDAWRVLRTPDMKRSPAVTASWVNRYAPQISSVYNDLAALETSIASLITRAAMGMSVALSTVERRASRRELFVDCLLGYQEFLRTPGRSAWSAAVIDTPQPGQAVEDQFRVAVQGIPFGNVPELHYWDGANSPIPLELARIASGAVARYVVSRTAPNPIFDAVKGKLINVPLSLTSYTRGRRR